MGTANKEFQQKQKASNPKKLKSEADKLKKIFGMG